MRPRHQKRPGFTLVEVMLAMAIFSMVIAAIYGTWRAIVGATKAGQIAAEDVQRKRVALRCIEQSLTYVEMYAANARHYGFVAENGSDAVLSFVARLPKDFPRSGRFGDLTVRRVTFAIEPGPDRGNDLVLRQAPLLSDFDLDEQEHPLVLMRDVKRMEMEFWDLRKKDWTDEWLQTNQVPKLMRIVITKESPDGGLGRGEEYVQIIAPASTAVQAALQGRGGVQPQPAPAPGLQLPPMRR